MKKQIILITSVFVSLFSATNLQLVADENGDKIFGTCFSDDVLWIKNNGWYWYDSDVRVRGGKLVYGGSYITSNERINKSDYGKSSGYIKTTAYRLKRSDGTWVNKLYLPVTSVDSVCK